MWMGLRIKPAVINIISYLEIDSYGMLDDITRDIYRSAYAAINVGDIVTNDAYYNTNLPSSSS